MRTRSSDPLYRDRSNSRMQAAPGKTAADVRIRSKVARSPSMRAKWARSNAVMILAATALAVTSSIFGWATSLKIARLFDAAVTENLPSVGKAQELQIALLEQRGFVASYMLDEGNEVWLNELERRKRSLSDWLARARATTHTAAEGEILTRLEDDYARYDNKRDEAVALYKLGQTASARRTLLEDVYTLYLQTHQVCEDFVACNHRYIRAATTDAHRQVVWASWTLGMSAALTCGLGIALLSLSFRRLLAEQRNREHEIRLLAAREVQERLLPPSLPAMPGFDAGCIWHPAEFAAGDCVDYLSQADGSVNVAIGDVSGHGLDAALLAVGTRAYWRLLADTRQDLGAMLAVLNALLVRDIGGEGRFVTFLLARLDLPSCSLIYANAGHPTGYVMSASGEVKSRLESQTLPLGILADTDFPPGRRIALTPGDVIVLLTDGVLEACSGRGDGFGEKRLLAAVRANRHRSAQEIADSIYRAVREHVRNEKLADDLTATVIRVMPGEARACIV